LRSQWLRDDETGVAHGSDEPKMAVRTRRSKPFLPKPASAHLEKTAPPVHRQFPEGLLVITGISAVELSKAELDMAVLGQLSALCRREPVIAAVCDLGRNKKRRVCPSIMNRIVLQRLHYKSSWQANDRDSVQFVTVQVIISDRVLQKQLLTYDYKTQTNLVYFTKLHCYHFVFVITISCI